MLRSAAELCSALKIIERSLLGAHPKRNIQKWIEVKDVIVEYRKQEFHWTGNVTMLIVNVQLSSGIRKIGNKRSENLHDDGDVKMLSDVGQYRKKKE